MAGAPDPMSPTSPVLPQQDALGWLWPRFAAPGVRAVMTSREGGQGRSPFDRFNLRPGIGDDEAVVQRHRQLLQVRLGVPSVRVDQVHGAAVYRVTSPDTAPTAPLAVADASLTTLAGVAVEIQVADCLPVLFADRQGRAVAAAHAGWRGLAGGVLEASVAALCEAAGSAPAEVEAWLGPCIGPRRFEVGEDVCRAFGADRPGQPATAAFAPIHTPAGPRWLADLPALARQRLQAAGVGAIGGNDGGDAWCTYTQAARWFSYRRTPRTGRMAALIWREPAA